jgi:hypothetical protein
MLWSLVLKWQVPGLGLQEKEVEKQAVEMVEREAVEMVEGVEAMILAPNHIFWPISRIDTLLFL